MQHGPWGGQAQRRRQSNLEQQMLPDNQKGPNDRHDASVQVQHPALKPLLHSLHRWIRWTIHAEILAGLKFWVVL